MAPKITSYKLGYSRPGWLFSLSLTHVAYLILLTTVHAGSSQQTRSDGATSGSVGTLFSQQRSSGDLALVKIRECQPIQIDACRNVLEYENTGMPNLAGHSNQKEAEDEFRTFAPLIHINCSAELSFLLCSVYTPMCAEIFKQVIGPCRPICERVRASCGPVLDQFGFPWPSVLNCDQFPISNDVDHMCMSGYNHVNEESSRSLKSLINSDTSSDNKGLPNHKDKQRQYDAEELQNDRTQNNLCTPQRDENGCLYMQYSRSTILKVDGEVLANFPSTKKSSKQEGCADDVNYNIDNVIFVNKTGHCSLLCGTNWNYSEQAKRFADVIVPISSSIVLIAAILTIIFHQLSATTNPHTHKMLMFMIVCLAISDSTLLLRSVLGRETVGCVDAQIQVSVKSSSHSANTTMIHGEPGNTSVYCTILFAISYYFSTASACWWLNISFAWTMVSRRRWTSNTLATFSTGFHILAWNIPTVLTMILLIRRQFGPGELLDICQISDSEVAATFILAPTATVLLIGVVLLLAGFSRCKTSTQQSNAKQDARAPTLCYDKHTDRRLQSEFHQKCSDHSDQTNHELSNEERESQINNSADPRHLELNKIKSAAILCAVCSVPLFAIALVHLYHFINKSDWINRWTGGSESPLAVQITEIISLQATSLMICLWMFYSRLVNCSYLSNCFCRKTEKKNQQPVVNGSKDSYCAQNKATPSASLLTESNLKPDIVYIRQHPVIYSDSERVYHETEGLYSGVNVGLMFERSGVTHADWETNYSNFV